MAVLAHKRLLLVLLALFASLFATLAAMFQVGRIRLHGNEGTG